MATPRKRAPRPSQAFSHLFGSPSKRVGFVAAVAVAAGVNFLTGAGVGASICLAIFTFAVTWLCLQQWRRWWQRSAILLFALGLLSATAWHSVLSHRSSVPPHGPHLRLFLLGGNVFVPDMAPTLTGIALDARVMNVGSQPTFALNWQLVVEHGAATVAQFTEPPDTLTARGPLNSSVRRASDGLARKAVRQRLVSGEPPIEGFLLFYVTLPKAVVQAEATVLHLTVEDSLGNQYSVAQKMGEWLQR